MKFKSDEWRALGPNVWMHTSGMRLHDSGTIKVPKRHSRTEYDVHRYLRLSDAARLNTLQVIWGNRRRALMAFSVEILADLKTSCLYI